ncbi:MAG TPA: ATP-binding protein [Candidatus Limnocylindrales bacterium]|nr:ATP-binding protein [Candidatus Limnocylindrales bacterium]
MTRLRLETQADFVERTIKAAPIRALAELIWNALDADAATVGVTFERNALGGITAIIVADDGSGMTYEQAVAGFRSLGGSWKDIEKRSRRLKRQLHGKQGRGRLLAFSLRGDRVTWRTVADATEGRQLTTVTVTASERTFFEVSDPESTNEPIGTVVRIDGISDNVAGIEGEPAWAALLTEFALYVEQYRPVISIEGRALDPAPLQLDRTEMSLTDFDATDPPQLTVVEWSIPVREALYLCDTEGVAHDSVAAPRPAVGLPYTAYLRWRGIEERVADLALIDAGHPVLSPLVELARKRIAAHLEARRRERQRTVIEEWRRQHVYPYEAEPADRIAEANRELFDVVAVAAAPAVNATDDKKARRLSLTLLRQALEREPGSAYQVLREVLDLPEKQLEDLRHLLERTSLTAIIRAAKSITDRLDFLASLRVLVFDEDVKKRVKERSQLHRMLETETWVFGEQFSLTASDNGLTAALAAHIKILGRDELGPVEPVRDAEGSTRRLDLMLARSVPHGRKEHEHLVVELKAPKVVIGIEEINQIKNYARIVGRDPRFDNLQVQWDFILVGTELDDDAQAEANQSDRERGLVSDRDGIRVWVRRWSEVIDEAEWRLNFVKERLGYAPDEKQALDYLRKAHAEFLPDGLGEPEQDEVAIGVGSEPEMSEDGTV